MKRKNNLFKLIGVVFALVMAMQINVTAQQLFLNEVEIDGPSGDSNACSYTEVRGTPGAVVPANTYFLSVNSDGANFGFANQVVNFGGQTIGANGIIVLFNNSALACPNRTYGAGSTFFQYFSALTVGVGSESYLIVRSTTPIPPGSDLDVNDDGVFDNTTITVLDGFGLIVNPEEEFVYGAEAGVVNISNLMTVDQPDAVTRFGGNNTPFAASAFYFGELAATPDETNQYAAPFSPNFPTGGMLTPGAPNVPVSAPAGKARADFDGDGRTDTSVFRASNGTWYLNRSTAGATGVQFGQSGDGIVPGDYDNDGRADVAVRRGEFWYILNSQNSTVSTVRFGLGSDIAVQRDYDGDGDTDLAVFRPSTGIWYVSTDPAINFGAVQFGQSGDVPVPGDYDGDGRDDIAVFRAGTWFLRQSTAGARAINFGNASDSPVQADYDGDNRDDIAVFRGAEGVWYAFRSSNSTAIGIRFGQSGDVPVPGDYDGDGTDDQAVFRGGSWFLNRSTGGAATVNFGVGSDQPVPRAYIP